MSVRHTERYICYPLGGGEVDGGWGHLLVDLIPMLERKNKTKQKKKKKKQKKKKKKNDEKGYFFQAGQCAALSSFRVRKMEF